MKKFTLILSLMVAMVTTTMAQTLVTDATTISNTKVYTLAPSNTSSTGVVCVPGADATQLYMSIHTDATQDADATNINQRFAFITVQDVTFMYSLGAQKFVADNGQGTSLLAEPTMETLVAFHASTGGAKENYPLVVEVGGDYLCVSNQTHFADNGYVVTNWNQANDAGCMMAIQEYEPTAEELALIESASTVCDEFVTNNLFSYCNKTVRVKSNLSGLYLQCVNYTQTSGEGAFQLKTKAEEGSSQLFTIEHAGGFKYYLKTIDNEKYVNAASWNFFAGAEATTPFTISLVEGETDVYSLYQSTAEYTGYAGNVTTSAADGTNIYNNQPSLTGCTTWVFEEVTTTPVTVNYSFKYNGVEKYNASYSAIVGGAYPDYGITFPYGVTAEEKPAGNIEEASVTDGVINLEVALSVDNSALPFVASESYDDENMIWYYLKFNSNNNYYLHHDAGQGYIDLDSKEVDSANKDVYSWAFIGDPFDGYKIVNRAAGEGYILSSSTTMAGTTGDGTYPIMTEEPVAEGNNTYWIPTKSDSGTKGFFLAQKGFPNNRMNDRGKLAYWTDGAGPGSTFMVVERPMGPVAELEALIESIEAMNIIGGTNLGEYTEASVNDLNAAIETAQGKVDAATATEEDVATLQAAFDALAIVGPSTEKVYAFNVYYNGFGTYMYSKTDGSTSIYTQGTSNSDTKALWQFVPAEGGFNIKNVHTNLFIGQNVTMTDDVNNYGLFVVTKYNTEGGVRGTADDGNVYIKFAGDTEHCLHSYNRESVISWGGTGLGNQVQLEEIPDFSHTLNVTAAEWATIVLGFDAEIPTTDGFKAYTIASEEDGYVTLADATGVLKANVPVLVNAPEGAYEFAYTTEAATVESSGLSGTLYDTYIAGSAYVLGFVDETVGFYQTELNTDATGAATGTTHFKNNANKVFFVPTSGQANVASYSFRFEGDTTGIEEVKGENGNVKTIYDLTGRRVESITAPGIYVVNGKKVLVK